MFTFVPTLHHIHSHDRQIILFGLLPHEVLAKMARAFCYSVMYNFVYNYAERLRER